MKTKEKWLLLLIWLIILISGQSVLVWFSLSEEKSNLRNSYSILVKHLNVCSHLCIHAHRQRSGPSALCSYYMSNIFSRYWGPQWHWLLHSISITIPQLHHKTEKKKEILVIGIFSTLLPKRVEQNRFMAFISHVHSSTLSKLCKTHLCNTSDLASHWAERQGLFRMKTHVSWNWKWEWLWTNQLSFLETRIWPHVSRMASNTIVSGPFCGLLALNTLDSNFFCSLTVQTALSPLHFPHLCWAFGRRSRACVRNERVSVVHVQTIQQSLLAVFYVFVFPVIHRAL